MSDESVVVIKLVVVALGVIYLFFNPIISIALFVLAVIL